MPELSNAGATPAALTRRGFTITRTFDASPKDVFAAWTDPEQVAAWFGPRGLTVPPERLSMDVRTGGSWTLTMVSNDDGAEYPVAFRYEEIEPPARLVLTTSTTGPDGTEQEVRVTVVLRDVGNRTEMTFAVEDLPTGDGNKSLRDGWDSSFDCLTAHLGRRQ